MARKQTETKLGSGNVILNIELDKGYWRVNPTLTFSGFDLTIYPCLTLLACSGGQNPDNYCSEGHEGVLCGVCKDNYFFSSTAKRCLPCESAGTGSSSIIMISVIIGVFVLVLLAYLNKNRLIRIQKGLEVAIATAQQLNSQGEDSLHNLAGNEKKSLAHHKKYLQRLAIWYKAFKIKGKILFVCYQLVSSIAFNCAVTFRGQV